MSDGAGRSGLIHDAEPYQCPDSRKAIPPGDLLALRIVTTSVVDRYLIDPVASLQHLGGDLGLKIKPVASDLEFP